MKNKHVFIMLTLLVVMIIALSARVSAGVINPISCEPGYTQCGNECYDLTSDNNNCGSCNTPCETGYTCTAGKCEAVPPVISPSTCGNGKLDSPEQCDGSNLNGASCASLNGPLYAGTLSCYAASSPKACAYDNSSCHQIRCGDGFKDGAEECDLGEGINGANGAACSASCKIVGVLGWHGDSTWKVNPLNMLVGTGSGSLTNDQPLNLKASTQYVLSYYTSNPDCTISTVISGNCISGATFSPTTCFADITNSVPKGDARQVSVTFTMPAAGRNSISGYYKGLDFTIKTSCQDPDAVTTIDNVSLSEAIPAGIHYDAVGIADSQSSCCPKTYCWNGTSCVDSALWMSDSGRGPIWNAVLDASLKNNHVAYADLWRATGYRCILDDNRDAHWAPSELKYDWKRMESGYCNRQSDCFVSRTFKDSPRTAAEIISSYDNDGSSCIKSGESVDDEYRIYGGDHYCMDGNWTTKSYLIANVLYNIGSGADNYIIYCDNSSNVFNDELMSQISSDTTPKMAASCSLITKGSSDNVVVGFATGSMDPQEASKTINYIIDQYNSIYHDAFYNPYTKQPIINNMPGEYYDGTGCIPKENGFYDCVTADMLHIYYNPTYKIYVMSNRRVDFIDPDFWDVIMDFFGFGKKVVTLNFTNTYQKLYLMHNSTMDIKGIEEVSYAEVAAALKTYLTLDYAGGTNRIDTDYIRDVVKVEDYVESDHSQNINITSNKSTGLFPYLTAMIR